MGRGSHNVRAASMLVLVLLAGGVAAEPIYRSVDADGNVTFSSKPPANAVAVDEVDVQSGPSAAAQREARERSQRQSAAARDMGKARADRAQQQRQSPQGAPAGEDAAVIDETEYYHAGYPYRQAGQRDRVREAVRERLQERPVQLPARPVMR